jgi:cell division protein FtsL
MDYSNNPIPTAENTKPNNSKNLIIGLLVAAVLILSGFMIYNQSKSNNSNQLQQAEVVKVTTEKSELQNSFDASLARLDSMTTMNSDMQLKLADKDEEIAKIKGEIRGILNKKNATSAELSKAKSLIARLNGSISNLEQQVASLKLENDSLKTEGVALRTERTRLTRNLDSTNVIKTNLEKVVDVASTLNASNISITPIKIKNNGKEKVKTTAKRVDKLVVSFDVKNRIIKPGTTDIYVVVIGPDGKPVTATPSGSFDTRNQGTMPFTAKLPVTLETATSKNIQFSFAPASHFQQGNYTIEIYQNGFLIGQGTQELKKGGLFS